MPRLPFKAEIWRSSMPCAPLALGSSLSFSSWETLCILLYGSPAPMSRFRLRKSPPSYSPLSPSPLHTTVPFAIKCTAVVRTETVVASQGIYHLEVPRETLPLGPVCGCRGGSARPLPIVASPLGLVMNTHWQHHTGKPREK